MSEKCSPFPDPKNKFIPRIKGLFEVDPDNPFYGLTHKRASYWLCFRNEEWKTDTFDLKTSDPVEAKYRRDEIYRKVTEEGFGARSKAQFIAQSVLENPKSERGFCFVLQFLGHTIRCESFAEMHAKRALIALEVLQKEGLNPPPDKDKPRHIKGHKYRPKKKPIRLGRRVA